jgi:hypothetical protein
MVRPTTAKPFMKKHAVVKPIVKKNVVKPRAMVKYGYYTDIPVIKSVKQGKSYAI